MADLGNYGGRRMHRQSFLALFDNRLGANQRALYLMDEPEVAL